MEIVKNYQQWNVLHYSWDSVDHFTQDFVWRPGIHTIKFGAVDFEIDILLSNCLPTVDMLRVPIIFSGALSKRGAKTGPFFSGRKISETFEVPSISVADPTLDMNPELTLGWYTGGLERDFSSALANLLSSLSETLEKELLLVGGSGGGFAALNLIRQLGNKVSVFVWNPQTDIYSYAERHVKDYLRQVYSFAYSTLSRVDWKEYCRPRTDRYFSTNVLTTDLLVQCQSTLYLQNRSDWHYESHLLPLWKLCSDRELVHGINNIDSHHTVVVHDLAKGHDPINPDIIGRIIRKLSFSPGSISDNFDEEWLEEMNALALAKGEETL